MEKNPNHFVSPIVDCPLDALDPQTNIKIEQEIFVPNAPPGSWRVDNMAHYNGIVMSLHIQAVNEPWNTVEGSAVLVAPGIAITATHILADLKDHILAGKAIVFCIGLTSSGLRIWRVTSCTEVSSSDLMILTLEYRSPLPQDNTFGLAYLTTKIPPVGEKVMLAGYRASAENAPTKEYQGNVPIFPVENGRTIFGTELRVGVGTVKQHHLSGRDRMLPGPTIEIDVALGGMSGGAVFDQRGMVFGITSTSLDCSEGGGTTFVSLVTPALNLPVTPKFINLYQQAVRILDLHPFPIQIDGHDRIIATFDRNAGSGRIEYLD